MITDTGQLSYHALLLLLTFSSAVGQLVNGSTAHGLVFTNIKITFIYISFIAFSSRALCFPFPVGWSLLQWMHLQPQWFGALVSNRSGRARFPSGLKTLCPWRSKGAVYLFRDSTLLPYEVHFPLQVPGQELHRMHL